MENISPQIVRQRLIIEAYYTNVVDENVIKDYLTKVAKTLDLRIYGEPIIHSPSGVGKESNQGYDAFVPLIDSGISLYIWTNEKFLSCIIYTCKEFSVNAAIDFTKDFFKPSRLVHKEF